MRTNILTLCDFAKDYNGQLNIMGTFNQIQSAVFPSNPVSFYIVCQFVIKENIIGDHFVNISAYHKESGDFVVPLTNFKLNVAPDNNNVTPDKFFSTNLILNLDKVVFQKPGAYLLKVESDKNTQELEFYVLSK